MESIFNELYNGNIHFDSQWTGPDSPFVKAAREKQDSVEKLTAILDDTGKELFDAYRKAEDIMEDIMRYDTFTRTLRFAIRFMVEVYTVGEAPPYEGGDIE